MNRTLYWLLIWKIVSGIFLSIGELPIDSFLHWNRELDTTYFVLNNTYFIWNKYCQTCGLMSGSTWCGRQRKWIACFLNKVVEVFDIRHWTFDHSYRELFPEVVWELIWKEVAVLDLHAIVLASMNTMYNTVHTCIYIMYYIVGDSKLLEAGVPNCHAMCVGDEGSNLGWQFLVSRDYPS